jgi:hypothetical protein
MFEELEIRRLIENWVLWRDAGDWDRFATVWHPNGRIMTTWCQASASEFIERSRQAWHDGLKVLHTLGGSSIELVGDRAVAQTKMQILQRSSVHEIMVDVICYGRFFDLLEKYQGRWTMVFRQPIYELDHMVPLDPAAGLTLDRDLLATFPEGYRHLAYLQTKLGFNVSRTCPGTRGPEVEALQERRRRWLAGDGEDFK